MDNLKISDGDNDSRILNKAFNHRRSMGGWEKEIFSAIHMMEKLQCSIN
jgi:hypothetical protein